MIRKYKNDSKALRELLGSYKKTLGEKPINDIQFDHLLKAIDKGDIEFYFYETDEVIAMCSVTIGFSTYTCEYFGIFEDFYVKATHRKSGVAKKLVHYVIDEMTIRKIKSLWVGCSNSDVDMYKHLGFNIPIGNLLTWNRKE